MPSDTTLPSLLVRMRDLGDTSAWREFDARYSDLILRYSRKMGLQYSHAEDVRQLVMLNLARSMPGFEYMPERGRFRSYLGQVVRNTVFPQRVRPNLMREAQVLYRQRLGPDHPDLTISLSNLAQMQYRAGDYEEVAATLRECLRIRETTLPPDDARVLSNQRLLGFALVRLERSAEAEPVLRTCYELQQRRGTWDENSDGRSSTF